MNKEWYIAKITDDQGRYCYRITDDVRDFMSFHEDMAEWLRDRLNGDDVDNPEDCRWKEDDK